MDPYRCILHNTTGVCKGGGIYCRYDRPRPGSSAGARRLARSKARSRREARARLRDADRRADA